MQIAVLGLGKMGKIIAEKLMSDKHEAVVWNRSKEVLEQYRVEKAEFVVNQNLQFAHSIEGLTDKLRKPRVIWSMLPAGEATDSAMQQVSEITEMGDIIIDGGNSHFSDTQRRYREFQQKGVKFLGIGVSGGIHGLENGLSLMAGGDQEGYDYILPLLDSLSKPNGSRTFFGEGGAGHFVKMVHNGIEYGMMQAIAEGYGILSKSEYGLNLSDVTNSFQEGSIISSFLLEMVNNALAKDPSLSQTEGYIDMTGEAKWMVEQAKNMHLPIPVTEMAVDFRSRSQYDKTVQESFIAKLVAAMRFEFGGHEMKKAEPASQQ